MIWSAYRIGIECLGDLARYHMAIEEADLRGSVRIGSSPETLR